MASSPSLLRRLWRVFYVAMIALGILIALVAGGCSLFAYSVHRSAARAAKNQPPVWHSRLTPLAVAEKVELLAVNDERSRDSYEAIIRITSPEARQAFEAQIATRRPERSERTVRDTPLYRRFIAEHSAEAAAPLAFDLYAGCPYGKDKTHPVLVIPGREGAYYILYAESPYRMFRP